MKNLTLTRPRRVALLAVAVLGLGGAAVMAQPQPRPDTEFCAKKRAEVPGGICSPRGEYVTAEKVYFPDGRVVNRSAGN